MALYCGLDFYTTEDINSLIQMDMIDGIVLGDLFCQRKMFEYGESQLYDYINIVGRSPKKLVYQPPIYITSRNRMQVIDTIKYINSNFADSVILTQDIGILKFIKDNCCNVEVAWSRMGRTREYSFNRLFYEALRELGVSLFETESLPMAKDLADSNIQPLFVYGTTQYRTIGRRCYCQYELNAPKEECARLCRESEYEMETVDGSYSMSIDGYMLGYKLKYNPDILNTYKKNHDLRMVLYAKDYSALQLHLKTM